MQTLNNIIMDIKEQIATVKAQYNLPAEMRENALNILTQLEKAEQMPPKDVMAYAAKIHPLIRGTEEYVALAAHTQNKQLFWAKPSPIHNESFTYNHTTPLCRANGLKEIGRITTYHRYGGYYGCLRPSTDEAIIQCPKEWLDKICAFEFQIKSDRVDDIYDYILDRHVLTTVYYMGTLPEEIANLPVKW